METKTNVPKSPVTGILVKLATIMLVMFLATGNLEAQVAQQASSLTEATDSSTIEDMQASHANSEFWGYVFAVAGILGGIGIAWFLTVATTGKKNPPHHGHHHHSTTKHRR